MASVPVDLGTHVPDTSRPWAARHVGEGAVVVLLVLACLGLLGGGGPLAGGEVSSSDRRLLVRYSRVVHIDAPQRLEVVVGARGAVTDLHVSGSLTSAATLAGMTPQPARTWATADGGIGVRLLTPAPQVRVTIDYSIRAPGRVRMAIAVPDTTSSVAFTQLALF